MILSDVARAPFGLRIIDMTANAKGWEHGVSAAVEQALKTDQNVRLAGPRCMVADLGALNTELTNPPDYNVLLIFAHGSPRRSETDEAAIMVGSERVVMSLFGRTNATFDGMTILLCVCGGANEDTFFALTRDLNLAHLLLASRANISKEEALAFFPEYLQALAEASQTSVDRQQAWALLDEYNYLSGGKMEAFPSAHG